MLVSAEGFFLLNFFMDFLVLSLALRGMWFPRTGRVALAALLGAGYSLSDGCIGLPWFIDAVALSAMFIVAFPRGRALQFLGAALAAGNTAVILAAVTEGLTHVPGLARAAFPLGIWLGALTATLTRRRLYRLPPSVWVRAQVAGRTKLFSALVDTGNMLREPISDLPVMIVTRRTLGNAFSDAAVTRSVSYGGVGSGGNLPCIKPMKLELYDNRKWVRAPEMWLGVYGGKINGGIDALAPGTVMQSMFRR